MHAYSTWYSTHKHIYIYVPTYNTYIHTCMRVYRQILGHYLGFAYIAILYIYIHIYASLLRLCLHCHITLFFLLGAPWQPRDNAVCYKGLNWFTRLCILINFSVYNKAFLRQKRLVEHWYNLIYCVYGYEFAVGGRADFLG